MILEEYRFRQRQGRARARSAGPLRHRPPCRWTASAVRVLANIELPSDAAAAVEAGAVGVGLFRSEFLFMNRGGGCPTSRSSSRPTRAVVNWAACRSPSARSTSAPTSRSTGC